MGLSAVVYKSKEKMETEYGVPFDVVDQYTGEVEVVDGHSIRIKYDDAIENRVHIGNIIAVDELKSQVKDIITSGSMIVEKVLYSGSHSGDTVELECFDIIERELQFLKKSSSKSLLDFCYQMDSLIESARSQDNPIVFV